jgi:hypothetical protein
MVNFLAAPAVVLRFSGLNILRQIFVEPGLCFQTPFRCDAAA